MKRTLLFILTIALFVNLDAQVVNKTTGVESSQKWFVQHRDYADPESPFTSTPTITTVKANKWPISSSANIYTLVVPESSCLSYDKNVKTLNFVHRGNPAAGVGSSSGNIFASFSTNYGVNWTPVAITSDAKSNRYPSGVLYNPTGNLDPQGTYVVASGPVTDGTNWVENFWASTRLDGTNGSVVYENLATYDHGFPRFGFSVCGDGKVHVLGNKYVFTTGVGITSFSYVTMNNGTFNSTTNKFDWTRVQIKPTFSHVSTDGTYEVASYSTTWSADGTVGYIYFIAIDSAYNQSYQPILYKSTDAGATWVKQANFDFRTISSIQSNIWSTLANDTVYRPYFDNEGEAVVDNNGQFHWFGIIKGAYSIHPDSLGYTFLFEPNKLYHVWTTASGWDAELVDVIYTGYVSSTDGQFGTGTDATGWDHRIQTARNSTGSKVFCVWTDTDTLYAVANSQNRLINSSPDLHAWGKDLTTNTIYPSTNFTFGTPLEAECFFHYVSEQIIEDGTNYIIPVSIADIDQVSANGPALPVYHYYVTNIGYGPTIGLNEVDKVALLDVSEIYPNPSNGELNVDVELSQSCNLELSVFDLAGRCIFTQVELNVPEGIYHKNFQLESVSPGLYIVNVKAGLKNFSRKVSIQ